MSEWQPIETMPEDNADDVDARFLQAAQSVPVVGNDIPQDWKCVDGAVAWHLMDRHGEGWAHIGQMMDAWLAANSIPAADLARLREKAAEADELRKDAERYRKLRGWMSSNVKEGWGRVTDLSAVFCYVSWQEGDSYLDNLPECNVGLMQKDAAIAQGKGE